MKKFLSLLLICIFVLMAFASCFTQKYGGFPTEKALEKRDLNDFPILEAEGSMTVNGDFYAKISRDAFDAYAERVYEYFNASDTLLSGAYIRMKTFFGLATIYFAPVPTLSAYETDDGYTFYYSESGESVYAVCLSFYDLPQRESFLQDSYNCKISFRNFMGEYLPDTESILLNDDNLASYLQPSFEDVGDGSVKFRLSPMMPESLLHAKVEGTLVYSMEGFEWETALPISYTYENGGWDYTTCISSAHSAAEFHVESICVTDGFVVLSSPG